ncbi:TetR/AcrR family transcriptional regulator [Cellulomonas soli]
MTRMPVAERRRALVDAAVRVIAREGVAGATTRAVVAEAGMKLASLHYAFGSREELLEAVIADVTEQERVAAEDGLLPLDPDDPAPTMAQVVHAGLDRFLDLLVEDPLRERALLELTLYALRTPGQEAALAAQYAIYHRSATATLETAARVARSRWVVPLPDAARLLVTLTDGLTTTWLADRDTAAARATVAFAAQALAALAVPLSPTGLADATPDDPAPGGPSPDGPAPDDAAPGPAPASEHEEHRAC